MSIIIANKYLLQCSKGFSDNQKRAIEKIKRITEHFGKDRWFTQVEVVGAGYKTLMALVNKNYLKRQYFDSMNYYQMVGEVTNEVKLPIAAELRGIS